MNNIFNNNWLSNLLEKSQNMKTFCVIDNAVENPDFILENVKESIKEITKHDERAIMRVFINNGQNFHKLENLRNEPIKSNETIHQWICRSINNDKYTVTFNGITRWNANFHNLTTKEVINPMVKTLGEPLSGVDSYAFIATHGDTPFGVHEDLDDSLIFHLGPNNKDVWIWEHDAYLDLVGNDERKFNFEDIESSATKFSLKPGDCLFIPDGDFHVFHNNAFSIFLGFILFPSSKRKILNNSIENTFTDQKLPSFSNDFSIDELGSLPQKQDIEKGFKDYIYTLRSNGYLIHHSIPHSLTEIKSNYIVNKSFSVPVLNTENFTYVYIKGTRIQFEKSESVQKTLDYILSNELVNLDKLFENISKLDFFNDYVFKVLIKTLIEYGILEAKN